MVNLTIRLSKGVGGASGAGADAGSGLGAAGEGVVVGGLLDPAVTVSCPEHLVLADLPVAKALGSVSDVTIVKVLGRKARRRLGDKVHFCVRCDFPIAIYGRLDPCEHIFCLTCARKDSTCYLCGERVLRIQRLEVLDGIFICGAPCCLKSFLKRQDFQLHVKENHADLIETADDREMMQQDVEFQKGTMSSELLGQAQALSHSSSAKQLSLQEQRGGASQLLASESQPSKNVSQKSELPLIPLEENQTQKQEGEYQKLQQNLEERSQKTRLDMQQIEETNFEEQNVRQSEVQLVLQPPLQQLIQPSLLPPPQPGIPIISPPSFVFPYPTMYQEGMNARLSYPLYQMPPAVGRLLPSPPLPPPRPPSGVPPPLMPPPASKRGKYEPGLAPPGEPEVDTHNYAWSVGSSGNYDPNCNYGGWPATQ